jgi:hypothetical protein
MGAFSLLGATFGIITTLVWKFYAFKMNALLKSCKLFAWSSSLCIILSKSNVRNTYKKIGNAKTQNVFVISPFAT